MYKLQNKVDGKFLNPSQKMTFKKLSITFPTQITVLLIADIELRKLSLTLLGILLNDNNPLKERLCERIQTASIPGKVFRLLNERYA